MKLTLHHGGEPHEAALDRPLPIGRSIVPHGPTSAFGLGLAGGGPVAVGGGVVLDTRRGGSVNCFDVTFNPHAHGTHTESIAHITDNGVPIAQLALPAYCVARLCTVATQSLMQSRESGPAPAHRNDQVIDSRSLVPVLTRGTPVDALIVRVRPLDFEVHESINSGDSERLPAEESPKVPHVIGDASHPGDLSGTNPPYFTHEAMALLAASPLSHLVVELPSIDRENDGGTTPNHRAWWGVDVAKRDATVARFAQRTITELARIPDHVPDGLYALSLQVAPFVGDAAPSRPILYALTPG